jgi:hypothetical protein
MKKNFPSSRRSLYFVTAAIVLATIAGSTAPVGATTNTTQDPYTQRKNVQKQQKAISGEISKLKTTDAQLKQQLQQIEANLKASQSAYTAAAAAAAAAQRAAELARGSEAQTTANYLRLRQTTKALAVKLYMRGFAEAQTPKLSPAKLAQAAAHGYMNILAVTRGQDVTERLSDLRNQMVAAREAAEANEAKAAAERARQQSALSSLQSNKSKQQNLSTEVERRLEATLSEAAQLAALDKSLAATIAARSKGGGGGSGRIAVGNVDVVTVRGITVARSIADKVAALIDKAHADGVDLSGYGYRNSSQQVALRRAHCGTSDYDVYEKPANQCHPPTARPGASMHERGLAIDFTYQGSIITSHSSPGFTWLSKNAKTYGLYNLASEPWHWSTNGN